MDKLFNNPEVIIAAIAVIISFVSIMLTVVSLKIQRIHNRKTVKPIGNIILSDYENLIAVNLKNAGVGPLIIISLKVSNSMGNSEKNIIDWIPTHPVNLSWSSFLADTDFVIPPGESLNIIELKTGNLISETFSMFRNQVREALSDLSIELIYKDIYDKQMPISLRKLKWFSRNLPTNKKLK